MMFVIYFLTHVATIIGFILLCETFINDNNANLFRLPSYNFVFKNRKIKSKGGVVMYIWDNIQLSIREDLNIFIEGEFESILLNPLLTVKLLLLEKFIIFPTQMFLYLSNDMNFDYLKIDSYRPSSDLLHIYLNANIIPMITKPTHITYMSATIINNIYVQHTTTLVHSGILYSDMSHHLPIFCLTGKRKPAKNLMSH